MPHAATSVFCESFNHTTDMQHHHNNNNTVVCQRIERIHLFSQHGNLAKNPNSTEMVENHDVHRKSTLLETQQYTSRSMVWGSPRWSSS